MLRGSSRQRQAKAPGEIDVVNSGLEGTMIAAYQEIPRNAERQQGIRHLTTAASVIAIQNFASTYIWS